MIRLSSGLRTSIITNYGLGMLMQLGRIYLYDGPQPEYADAAPTSVKLAVVCQDGIIPAANVDAGGLQLRGGPDAGTLINDGTWVLKGLATGTPLWWRFVWNGEDNEAASSYYPRIDGQVGESLVLSAATVGPATAVPISSFFLVFPSE